MLTDFGDRDTIIEETRDGRGPQVFWLMPLYPCERQMKGKIMSWKVFGWICAIASVAMVPPVAMADSHADTKKRKPTIVTIDKDNHIRVNGVRRFVYGSFRDPSDEITEFAGLKKGRFDLTHAYRFESNIGGVNTAEKWIRDARSYLRGAERNGIGVALGLPRDVVEQAGDVETARKLVEAVRNEPALWLWYLSDEPGRRPDPTKVAANLHKIYKMIKKADPNHPVVICGTHAEFLAVPNADNCDIMWPNTYPAPDGPWLWTMQVPSMYASRWPNKPQWGVSQAFDWPIGNRRRVIRDHTHRPNAKEIRAQVHANIAAGVHSTVFYWSPTRHEGSNYDIRKLSSIWRAVCDVGDELKVLEPALLSKKPTKAQAATVNWKRTVKHAGRTKDQVYHWQRWHDGKLYVGVVNAGYERRAQVTIDLPFEFEQVMLYPSGLRVIKPNKAGKVVFDSIDYDRIPVQMNRIDHTSDGKYRVYNSTRRLDFFMYECDVVVWRFDPKKEHVKTASLMTTGTGAFVVFASLFFGVLLLAWGAAPAMAAADKAGAGPDVDASLFPQAYGVLANEHLMYPVDMSDWPVKIGPERQLFVDDCLIASRSNLTRQVHSAKPYGDNPILRLRKKPWEQSFGDSAFVLRDEKTGHFRMWYNMRSYYEGEDGFTYRAPTCYATSTDGIHWDKPNLGIWAYKGDKNNNITLLQGAISGLSFEPDEPDPAKRYKALVWHDPKGQKYAPREGFYLYYSPDGLHWTRAFRRCAVPNGKAVNFPLEPVRGLGDTTNFRWDWKLKKYVANCKIPFDAPDARARALLRGPTLRTLGHSESDDLIHWTRPRMTIHRDGLDMREDQCGELTSVPYESMWIGLLGVYRWENKHRIKQKHTQLVASRDGRHWTRVGKREPFHPLGAEDAWDPDFTFPARPGPIRIGNELWCYFWGERRPERFQALGWPNPRHDMHIGLAKLRIDGFVSLNGGVKPGKVVTRPLTFEGKTLRINAEIAPGGRIRVAVRDMAGKTVAPHTLAGCRPVTGDVFDAKVSWTGRRTIRHTAGQSLRLVFELKKAKLYSFWIE